MTTECPHCGAPVEISVTHTGTSSDGRFQRATIEATHAADACPSWAATQHDLVTLAQAAT